MVSESGDGVNDRGLLSSSHGTGGNEDTSVLAPVCTAAPLASGRVPEGLPLSWEVTIAGWDTEEKGIVFLEGLGVDDRVVGLLWCVHLKSVNEKQEKMVAS